MERFVKGKVVVVPFPFSDLSSSKVRPALVVSALDGYDVILCMITTRNRFDDYAISLCDSDFSSGGLKHDSMLRTNRLFSADTAIIQKRAGKISMEKMNEVIERIIEIVKG